MKQENRLKLIDMTATRIIVKKRYSQNFLTDANIAEKIARLAEIDSEDCVVEIGSGRGMLTRYLLHHASAVRGVEIDRDLWDTLENQFGSDSRFTLIRGDFMRLPMEALLHPERENMIIGNIPYHITTPILFRCLDYHQRIRRIVLMVQKEVASRIAASPGSKDYGILSVLCGFYAQPRLLFSIPPSVFLPRPSVDSAVIALDIRRDLPEHFNFELFHKVVRAAFNQRRKMLRNSLQTMILSDDAPIDLSRRPETIRIQEFLLLTQWIEAAHQELN